jgi:hypothetical protein
VTFTPADVNDGAEFDGITHGFAVVDRTDTADVMARRIRLTYRALLSKPNPATNANTPTGSKANGQPNTTAENTARHATPATSRASDMTTSALLGARR